jgi:hypothetical protein
MGIGMILTNPWNASETLSNLLYAEYCDFEYDGEDPLDKVSIFANSITFVAKEFFRDYEPELPF